MGMFLHSPVVSFGGGMLEDLLPLYVYWTDSSGAEGIYLTPCLETNSCCSWIQQHTFVHIYWLCEENLFFPVKNQPREMSCFVQLQNISPSRAHKYMNKHLILLHKSVVILLFILNSYRERGRDNFYCPILKNKLQKYPLKNSHPF